MGVGPLGCDNGQILRRCATAVVVWAATSTAVAGICVGPMDAFRCVLPRAASPRQLASVGVLGHGAMAPQTLIGTLIWGQLD